MCSLAGRLIAPCLSCRIAPGKKERQGRGFDAPFFFLIFTHFIGLPLFLCFENVGNYF